MKQAILLVDHGSRRPAANELLERVAERLRAREPRALVSTAHLEIVEPGIGAGIDACVAAGATHVIVHPYFLGPGRHTQSDIPKQVAEAAERHPAVTIRVTEPLGLHEKLVDVILERVGDASSE